MQTDTQAADHFMRLPQVLKMIPVSRSTLWNKVKQGDFPKPYKIGSRAVAWKFSEVEEVMQRYTH